MTIEQRPGGVVGVEQAGALQRRAVTLGPAAIAANVEFVNRLGELTRHLPAAAVASWDAFPEELDARVCVPPPVRIGTSTTEDIAIVVPTDGEDQWRYGSLDLTIPVGPGKPSTVGRTIDQQAADKKEAELAARAANRERLAGIVTERTTAIEVIKGLATRVFASVAPGSVSLDVCGPKDDTLPEFSDFGVLRPSGLYRPSSPRGLHELLVELDQEQALRSGTILSKKYPTLRSRAEATKGLAPEPFRMIAIFGDGRPVDPKDLALLDDLMRNAHPNGHMMFVHGIRFPENLPWTDIAVHQGRVDTPALPLRPRFDGGPPSELVERVSAGVADARDAKGGASSLYVSVGYSGASYRMQIQKGLDIVAGARRTDTYHDRQYPWLKPDFLNRVVRPSVEEFIRLRRLVASHNPDDLSHVRNIAAGKEDRQPDYLRWLVHWAALDLAESTLGHGEKWRLSMVHERAAQLIERQRQGLASVVGVTQRHIPQEANTPALPTEALLEDPPVWAFQLLADRAIAANWMPSGSFSERELNAVLLDIETTYGLREQLSDRPAADCLAACRYLDLNGFTQLHQEHHIQTRTMLVRYVEHAINRLSREEVAVIAPNALPVYDDCQNYLENVIGRTVTVGDVIKGSASTLVTGALSLITRTHKGGPNNGKEDGKGAGPAGTSEPRA